MCKILPFRNIKTVLDLILFPVLPMMGLIFILAYFSIGFYVYNYPSIDNDKICGEN